MKKVELSGRMQAVADFVTQGNRVCDVGCDHGYVSIYLVQEQVAPCVLAMDVNKGPLLRAKEHVQQYHVEDYITLRLSDGLKEYNIGEADTLICAGMGGRLLWEILSKEPAKTADFKELILQPQSEIGLFRQNLRENGYEIVAENMVLEDGKFYPMMKVIPPQAIGGKSEMAAVVDEEKQRMEDNFGPILLKEKHPILLAYVEYEIAMKEEIADSLEEKEENEKICLRKAELADRLKLLRMAEKQIRG